MEEKDADGNRLLENLRDASAGAFKCIQCGICSSSCPSGRHTNLNIRKLVKIAGRTTEILSNEELWMCTTCYNCQERCPRNIDIVDVLLKIRAISVHKGIILPEHREVCQMLIEKGHAVPINDANKEKRIEIGLEELPETVHKYEEGLEEVKKLINSCGFEELIQKKEGTDARGAKT